MFELFTERARQVVVLAQEEARALRHDYIGSEHLLLGLFREQEGLAARVFMSLSIVVEDVRERLIQIVGRGAKPVTDQIPFTRHAMRALELALSEAMSLGHDYIGTEHLLLGIVRQPESRAAAILNDLDTGTDRIRNEVMRMLGLSPD